MLFRRFYVFKNADKIISSKQFQKLLNVVTFLCYFIIFGYIFTSVHISNHSFVGEFLDVY